MLLRGGKGHARVHFLCVMSPQSCALAVLMGGYKHLPLCLSYSPSPWQKIPVEAISSHYHQALSVHLGATLFLAS